MPLMPTLSNDTYLQGFKPKRSLEVMMFTSEEPTRFRLSCIGSRAMAGALTAEVLNVKLDENGTSFAEVCVRAKGVPGGAVGSTHIAVHSHEQ